MGVFRYMCVGTTKTVIPSTLFNYICYFWGLFELGRHPISMRGNNNSEVQFIFFLGSSPQMQQRITVQQELEKVKFIKRIF